ncbi:MAG: ABC transporter permease [Ilumatobacter sp.]|uniref:ABC transporter permease n=1 Tax=Ilumatobacter sp. TaxID=1967498 RepID=UPI00260C46E7|nr:ABC transporter permease [Ilumatobacter sp.]MDJ0767902.1 ABC transporter permease [Ilumatobacter sp.]
MLALTLKNLKANRVRFALTALGVTLAVSFVVSAFVLADGLRSTFGDLSAEIVDGTDLEVRPVADFGDPVPLTDDALASVQATSGVRVAEGFVEADENAIRPIRSNGEEIPVDGPPQLAFSWNEDPQLNSFTVVEGSAPDAPSEFVIDVDSADRYDFVVGDTYTVITPTGVQSLTLAGTTSFGENNDTLGAILMNVDVDATPTLFGTDGFDSITVALDAGTDQDAVMQSIASTLADVEVVDNETLLNEQSDEFNSQIGIIQNVLLGFAGISLFVSIFIIYNTFAIVLSQRTRELALLRTVGADPLQLRRSVLGEALVIGLLASGLGIVGGLGAARGLEALFGLIGADFPESPTIIATRTIVAALAVGVGVTMLAAFGPSRKAAKVPPIAALRDGAQASETSGRTRVVAGGALLAVGATAGAFGLVGAGTTAVTVTLLAGGAAVIFLGVSMLSPLLAGPVTHALGWPAQRLGGVAGRLAQRNAGRNPRRTATTAAALMIGLSMVTMALVIGESAKSTVSATLENSVEADYLVTDTASEAGFPTSLARDVEATGVFDAVSGYRAEDALIGGEVVEVTAVEFDAVASLYDIDVVTGSFDTSAAEHPVMVVADTAAERGLAIGDRFDAEFAGDQVVTLTMAGTFDDQSIVDDDYLVDVATFDAVGSNAADDIIAMSIAEGTDAAAVDAAIALLGQTYPQAAIDTAGEFSDRIEAGIDQILTTLNAMVALAVVIALIGIANTLALSVFERTRELGLSRAVGMTRRQLRRTIRFEAGIVAAFGAVLGVVIGIGFGTAIVTALPSAFASTVAIPYVQIGTLVAIATLAGLLAAWLPARRAGKLNVLAAISH